MKQIPYRPIYYYYDTSPIIQWAQIKEVVPGIDCSSYMVSTHGDIYDKILNQSVNIKFDKDGYRVFYARSVSGKGHVVRVHRAVLFTFNYIPGCENLQVNHIDGIPGHDWLTNLEWVTNSENGLHAVRTGLHKMYGEDNPNGKLTTEQVHEICKFIETGEYWDTEIADMYDVSYSNISDIHKGKIWQNVSQYYDLSNRKPRKFSKEQIACMCEDIQSGNYSYSYIAKKYDTSLQQIYSLLNGEIHTDVSANYDLTVPQGHKAVDKITARKICELIQTGNYNLDQISNMCSVSKHLIWKIKKGEIYPELSNEYDLSVPYRNIQRGLSEENVIEICSMINSGLTNREIGDKFGVLTQVINNIRKGQAYKEISSKYLNFNTFN